MIEVRLSARPWAWWFLGVLGVLMPVAGVLVEFGIIQEGLFATTPAGYDVTPAGCVITPLD